MSIIKEVETSEERIDVLNRSQEYLQSIIFDTEDAWLIDQLESDLFEVEYQAGAEMSNLRRLENELL